MREEYIQGLRLISDLGLAAFMAGLVFVALAHFFEEGQARHIVGALICLILTAVFLLRMASHIDPPPLDPTAIDIATALLWATTLIFVVIWVVLLAVERWRIAIIRRRIRAARPEKERE